MERDPRITDLVSYAIGKKAVEFQDTFNDILTDRIAVAVDARKVDIAQSMFAEPEAEATPEPTETEPEEEETDDGKEP